MSTRRTINRPDMIRLLPLLLMIPVAAAAFAPPADEFSQPDMVRRSTTLHPISRMVEASSDWQIVARTEDPMRHDWALIVWHDGPRRPGMIDPCELVVFTQTVNADALVATSLCEHVGPCDPMMHESVADPSFIRFTRRDIRYCARVVSSAEDSDSVELTSSLLDERVRELDNPGLLLTSTLN
ncbi:MAG: hypothetical protein P8J45_06835 [Phycisphaerales bacterium]|nr:hypothetical protein [Phycisphaerales bacterium]